jgi:hypothetical protein
MSVILAFTTGIKRATSEFRMVLLLYVVNVLAVLGLTLAFRSVLVEGFGATTATSSLMSEMNYMVLQEFLREHGEELGLVLRQIVWFSLIYMIVNTLLAGGILTIIREKDTRFSLREFFSGCGTYFFRFLRLFLLFGILLIVCALLWIFVLGVLFDAITAEATSEVTWIISFFVMVVLFLLPIMIVILIADYAKISTVLSNTHSMLRTAWRAVKFVFRNFIKVISLQLLMLLIPIVLFVIYLWLDLSIGMTTVGTIYLMLLLQQFFILTRVWSRVLFFSGEMELFEDLQIAR